MNTREVIQAIPRGSVVIVHASFSPCKAEGLTPEGVISMLRDQLGPDGTLIMPSFTYSYSKRPGGIPFDRETTPGCGMGILSETFRKTPGVIRSSNPTYSVLACGKHAYDVTDGAQINAGLSFGSSYEKALQLNTRILLLNVGNNRNSMLHYAEAASGVPYNDIPHCASWGRTAITSSGEMELNGIFPACSVNFKRFDDVFVREGIAVKLGNSYLIDAPAMVDYIIKQIRAVPDIMLCDNPKCEPCVNRRQRLREKGLL